MSQSQVQIGPKPLAAVQEEDEESVDEIIGFLTFSTTGEALVPREWLLDAWEDYGLPNYLIPSKPSNWQAYRRMKNELLDDAEYRHYQINSEEHGRLLNCKFDLEKSDEMGSNTYIVYSKMFIPEEVSDEEGGDWETKRVGRMEFYRPDDDMPGQLLVNFDENGEGAKGTVHEEACKELAGRARELFNKMQSHHNYSDLQKIIDGFRDRANAIAIRRAVYFVGSHHQETVEGLSRLWKDMNQFKDHGEEMRIETTPVVNIESQREMVAERVREKVESLVDDIVGEKFNSWEDDETTDETARKILNSISEEGVSDITHSYNELLSLRLSVKEILKDKMQEVKDEEKEALKKAVNQATLKD